ncbi:MAG: hypothetical protein AVDCRST_MAG23-2408, partial [uncultured Sphingosinicella sp.]
GPAPPPASFALVLHLAPHERRPRGSTDARRQDHPRDAELRPRLATPGRRPQILRRRPGGCASRAARGNRDGVARQGRKGGELQPSARSPERPLLAVRRRRCALPAAMVAGDKGGAGIRFGPASARCGTDHPPSGRRRKARKI